VLKNRVDVGQRTRAPIHNHASGGLASKLPATSSRSQARTLECGTLGLGSANDSATAAAKAAVSASSSSMSGTADLALFIIYHIISGSGCRVLVPRCHWRRPNPCIRPATPL
jgi:hypothetical protein